MRYCVVFEKTGTGYSAYAPDLPGCVAADKTLEQTRKLMAEAMALHIDGLQRDGLPVPEPTTIWDYVEVS